MNLYRSDAAHQGAASAQVTLYLGDSDRKKLERLRKALGVSDQLANAKSITVSKLIRLAYDQHFPPRKPASQDSCGQPNDQPGQGGPAPRAS